jgi:hypothetical protein
LSTWALTCSLVVLAAAGCCKTNTCPTPVVSLPPPPRVVQLDPPECIIGDEPAPVVQQPGEVAVTPAGLVLSVRLYRDILRRELAWQSWATAARLCERRPDAPAN